MFQVKFVKKNQKAHLMFGKKFSEYCAVYEIMWKNMLEADRPQMVI
jgi:hypothetical protein